MPATTLAKGGDRRGGGGLNTPKPEAVLDGFSLNSATVLHLGLVELLREAERRGFQAVGLWRDNLEGMPLEKVARLLEVSGLRLSSLCRAGLFTHPEARGRRAALGESKVAVDQAAALGAAALVVVPGGLVGRDLSGSRQMVRDSLGELATYADEQGVKLAVEPMHPLLVQERSVITSLREANNLVEDLGNDCLGVTYDTYHVWWDSALALETARCTGRIWSVQVADWLPPTGRLTACRGVPGEGCIDLPGVLALAREDGAYAGDIEVEVLSEAWWGAGPEATLDAVVAGLAALAARPGP